MTVLELRHFWMQEVGGPNILFALRIASTVPLLIYAALMAYEVASPLHRHPLTPPRDSAQWRVIAFLISLCALGGGIYYLISGTVDKGVKPTTLNFVFANVFFASIFWLQCLQAMKRRKDSWARKYLGALSA